MKKSYKSVFAMGGNVSASGLRLRKKMFAGGNPDQDTSGDDPVDGLPKDAGLTQGPGTGLNSYAWADDPQSAPPQPASGSSFLQRASRVAGALTPYLSNIYNAGRTPPMPSNPNLVAPVTLSKIRLDATRQQALSASRAQDINADRSLDEQSAAAVRSSNLAKNLNQQGQISEQEAFLNARQKAEAAGMNLNVDAMNTNAINKVQDEKVQRGIAIQREQSSNISNAADKYISMQNEQNKAKVDMQKIQTLSQIWKQSGVYDRMIKKMKDSGNNDPTGIHSQMGWLGDIMDSDNTETKAAGGALLNPLVGKKPVHPTLLSKPMTGQGKNGFKQVFATGGPGDVSAGLSDRLNYSLISGNVPKGLAPGEQGLFMDANVYHQTHPGMTPEDTLNGYYGRPVDPSNPADMMRGRLGKMNNGPVANYWATADPALQARQAVQNGKPVTNTSQMMPMASRAFGGYRSTMGNGYLNPFGNTRTIGLGPGIQKDKFNPYHVGHQQHNLLAMGGVPKSDGASDVNKDFTNYGDATPDLYEYGGIGGGYRMGGPFQEEWRAGGNISHPKVVDHSMWKQPYKENALTNNDPMFAEGGDLYGPGPRQPISTTAVAHRPLPRMFDRTSNGQPVRPSYEFMPAGASAADSTSYRQGFQDVLSRMNSKKLQPMDSPAFLWSGFNSGSAEAQNPGLDTPGQSNAFNSGAREGYMNMPAGSFRQHAMGGEFSGEATAKDMSMWNRKVWSKAYSDGGPMFNEDYFQGDQPVGLYAAAGGPLFNKDYFDDEPVQIFAANGGPVFNSDYFNDDPVQVYKNGGINVKPSHKGRFTAYKARTGKTTSEALQSSDPHVRQMANFARNASKWKHGMGGRLKQVY